MYVEAILPVPLPHLFTYRVPEDMQHLVAPGVRLYVPFGRSRHCTALAVRTYADAPQVSYELKDVIEVLDTEPSVLPEQMRLLQWMTDYYMCAPGDVLKALLPAALRPQSDNTGRRTRRKADAQAVLTCPPNELSGLQADALAEIRRIHSEKDICLLHGVTSSGKTEVYIHLMSEQVSAGKQVLFMLPEIALTVHMTERLRRVFGDEMCVYHSRLTDAQRAAIWRKQLGPEPYKIVVGARSSVFLPFKDLGLVVVDEEHETSYKQEDPAPRYNGRNVAMVLASYYGAKVVLGSATPSLESYRSAMTGRYGLVAMDKRFGNVALPEVLISDVYELRRKKIMKGLFSPLLEDSIREALELGEQVILFRNRRGYSPQLRCTDCGWIPRCDACDVSLTYHKNMRRLTCHYCGKVYDIPAVCPECGSTHFSHSGYGTEKVEEEILKLFPGVRTARLDLDTATTTGRFQEILDDFQEGRTDILTGTQMVTKGLDFDRVSVVGVLDADSIMGVPDFRAAERAFQMLAQVAGRAGRRESRGKVIIETRSADSELLSYVRQTDYRSFFNHELEERSLFGYPPFSRIISIYVKGRTEPVLNEAVEWLAAQLTAVFGTRVLGPDAPPVARVQMQYIRKFMLKFEVGIAMAPVRERLLAIRSQMEQLYTTVTVFFDVDPM